MEVSEKGIAALVAHEGVVPAPYLDSVGVWTVGVGHTAAAGAPIPANMRRGVPNDLDAALRDVFAVFSNDLERYAADVRRAVKVPMAQHEFDAAVSFHFNTGAIARASWVKHWNAGNKAAATKAIMNWTKPMGITQRRRDERDLFAHGRYPKGKATVWSVSSSGRVIWKPLRRLSPDDVLGLMRHAPIMPKPPQPAVDPVIDTTPAKPPQRSLWVVLASLLASIFGKGKA